jgi:UDP-N-acetylmuramyl pentapeptide phosphotransferase/UDP-N-acetylglucosamine-1-phosphate transferase
VRLVHGALLFLAAGAVSASANFWTRALALRRGWLDQPNVRSAHAAPVPRLGGIGIITGVLLVGGATRALSAGAFPILAAAGAVFAVGLIDDLRSTSVGLRLWIHIVAACLVVAARWGALPQAFGPFGAFVPAWVLATVVVIWIVWVTNLYNFMDGIDGLAGGQALIGGMAIAFAAWLCGAPTTATLAIALAGASLGFLFLNFPPSSIFMGDVGSTAIGFFFGCVPLLPDRQPVSIEIVAVALSLFILDATVTLLRRVVQGKRWYEPHRSHYYQRPLAVGVGHRPITLGAYLGFAVVGVLAVLMVRATAPVRLALGAGALLVFGVAIQVVRRLERAHGSDAAARAEGKAGMEGKAGEEGKTGASDRSAA